MFTSRDQPVLRCAGSPSRARSRQPTSCDVQRERCENYVRAMQVELADWFKQAGIELVFVDGGTNARGPLADLVNNIVASFAEFERELIRERLLDAHARTEQA